MMSIDQVKRLEQPMLVRLIDEGQLILEKQTPRYLPRETCAV